MTQFRQQISCPPSLLPILSPQVVLSWVALCRGPVSKQVAGLGGLSPQLYFQEQAEQQVTARGAAAAAAGYNGQQDHGAALNCQGCTIQPVSGLQGRTVW